MDEKVKRQKDNTCELKIKLTPEETKDRLEETYKEINKNVQIPGFRKGNAPKDIIKEKYSGMAKGRVKESAVSECYKKVLMKHDIQPMGEPRVTELNLKNNLELNFKVEIPVKPEIKLKKYKGIKLTKEKVEVDKEEVNKTLKQLREQRAELKTVESGQAKEGSFIVCDIKCKVEGEIIEDKENITIPIREEFPIPELLKGLKGSKAGEKKEIEAKLPQDIYEEKNAGKTGKYFVTIHEIKQKELPELNDEFAKQLGGIENLKQLKERIREDIRRKKEQERDRKLERQLLDKLLSYNKFRVPQSLIEKEKESMIDQTEQNLGSRGMPQQQIEAYKQKMLEDIDQQAEKRVKNYFLLNSIAKEEDITVTEEEIENKIDELAKSSGQSVKEFKEHLRKENLSYNLLSEVKSRKIINFLLDKARIKEK